MSTEMVYCPKCRDFFEADNEDVGTYFCPIHDAPKPKIVDYELLREFINTSFKNNINKVRGTNNDN